MLSEKDEYPVPTPLTEEEELAWSLYCSDTKNDFDVRDFWQELPARVQGFYLIKARLKMRTARD